MATLKPGVFPPLMQKPVTDDLTKPFWDATAQNKLMAAKCTHCGTCQLLPAPFCYACQHREYEWIELPGTGTIYTYTVVRHPLMPQLKAIVPYASGVIELDGTQGAGARIMANIIDCDVEKLSIGDKVKVVFDKINDELTVPRFAPV
jgi:uncharacterized protein